MPYISISGQSEERAQRWSAKTTRTIVLVVILLAFLYFLWPTPYVYFQDTALHRVMRVNRFTGRVEYAMDPGWQSVEEMSGVRR